MKIGSPSNFVLQIDFNALPSSVTWVIEEEAQDDSAAAQESGQPPAKVTTHESDILKRMDIYGCT